MRALEVDVFNDPAGGRFYERQGLRFINEPTASNLPGAERPGMKVLHVPDFDYETHHLTFVSALRAIATWSDAHPRHLPLFIQIESKASTVADVLTNQGFTVAAPFDAAAADALDTEILSVFAAVARHHARRGARHARDAGRSGHHPGLAAGRSVPRPARCFSWKGRRSSPTWRARPAWRAG